MTRLLFALLAIAIAPATPAALNPAAPIDCRACAEWNTPQAPFRIHGRSWYVGPRGLSALLLATDDGLVLFDGALPQSVPLITANLAALGFALDDLRWILISHPHFDHVGGVAELQRLSGARVGAAPLAAAVLRRGDVPDDDPQAGFGAAMHFAPVAEVVEIADGGTIELGGLTVTALHTPGHTPGGSSWYWTSCEAQQCRRMLYADSLTAVSHADFRFGAHPAQVDAFRRSIERVRELDCELLVAAHPGFTDLFERQAAIDGEQDEAAFVDPAACRRYADAAGQRLEERLARENP
jgi:metallo-beta-lactamase class B